MGRVNVSLRKMSVGCFVDCYCCCYSCFFVVVFAVAFVTILALSIFIAGKPIIKLLFGVNATIIIFVFVLYCIVFRFDFYIFLL